MNVDDNCPPFLLPRLRLFLSADIVGSTSLKQTRAQNTEYVTNAQKDPEWFSAIQGFYFEATQAFLTSWSRRKERSDDPDLLYGEEPTFWKSIGDEVLFTKILTDHRQLAATLICWFDAVSRMRMFLKNENSSLDVKCTAWLAGFPYRNREVAVNLDIDPKAYPIEDYYKESGRLLNTYYGSDKSSSISVDYIGPSIDTGFRLTAFSSHRKMVLSVDAAYLLSMTSFDGEVKRINLHYDGSHILKGVMGSAPYPVFWINMSQDTSLAVKEDKLKAQNICNKEDVKEFCDAFYTEYKQYMFRPFIKDDAGQTLAKTPTWYNEYHSSLVKNFNTPSNIYDDVSFDDAFPEADVDDVLLTKVLEAMPLAHNEEKKSEFIIGDTVLHKKFGKGLVIEVQKNAITVDFPTAGRKRLLSSFINLER